MDANEILQSTWQLARCVDQARRFFVQAHPHTVYKQIYKQEVAAKGHLNEGPSDSAIAVTTVKNHGEMTRTMLLLHGIYLPHWANTPINLST